MNKNKYKYGIERGRVLSVREAKASFSEILHEAAKGSPATITLHGKPAARIVGTNRNSAPFKVNWDHLRKMKITTPGVSATTIIRADREGRG